MVVAASLKSLFRRRTRTLLALAGIAISAALLLDMTMMATGLTDSFGELIGARGYDLRVTPRGTLPFDSEAGIRDASAARAALERLPGVAAIAPVLGAQLFEVRGDTVGETVFATGLDPRAQMLYTLLSGTDAEAGQAVISRPMAEAAGLEPGDTIRLAAELDLSLARPRSTRALIVSGIGDFLYDAAGQRSVALELAELQRMTARPDEVSLFGVASATNVPGDTLARRIMAALPTVSAYSTEELLGETSRRLLYFRQLATILGSVALVVTALLVSTIITIGVRERWGELATLRALGIAKRRLLLGIAAEGFTLATLGCLLGLPLGLWMAARLDRILLSFPGIPARLSFFVWNAERVSFAFALVIAAGVLAGLLPGWNATRVPLSRVLREEAE